MDIPPGAAPVPTANHAPAPAGDFARRGNALPLLHEIRHALERLADLGETTVIDLRAIPFGPGDEAELEAALGRGEVTATIEAMGPSTIQETAFPGVWLLTHRSEAGEILSRFIEVTFVPTILGCQREDVREGLEALTDRLTESGPPGH